MKNQKGFLSAALVAGAAFAMFANSGQVMAAPSDVQTYTLNIPTSTVVELGAAGPIDFGAITINDFGVANTTEHVIVVGDGSGADAYVKSNNAARSSSEYQLTFDSVGGSVVTVLDDTTIKVDNAATPTASVNIFVKDSTQSGNAKLASTDFVKTGNLLHVPANSSVAFDSNGVAPLDLAFDLDETTLGFDDVAGDISYTMTFTAMAL